MARWLLTSIDAASLSEAPPEAPRQRINLNQEDSDMRLFCAVVALTLALAPAQERPQEQGFSFRSNVDLINVSVTVTDSNGRFVGGLKKDDFDVYEDGVLQQTSHFDAERVPVSLGLAVDTSGSMVGDKWEAAQAALDRFLNEL